MCSTATVARILVLVLVVAPLCWFFYYTPQLGPAFTGHWLAVAAGIAGVGLVIGIVGCSRVHTLIVWIAGAAFVFSASSSMSLERSLGEIRAAIRPGMNEAEVRDALASLYPERRWRRQVLNDMPANLALVDSVDKQPDVVITQRGNEISAKARPYRGVHESCWVKITFQDGVCVVVDYDCRC